jgi:hypothetical protein
VSSVAALGFLDAGSDCEPFRPEAKDFRCASSILSWSGSGGEMKSRNELSDVRGAFHGNRRRLIQQKMIAIDQMSAIRGSYLGWS